MILDTNALSAFAEGDAAVAEHVRRAAELYLPVIVLGEYRYGIAASRRRAEHERWLTRGRAFWNILPVVEATALVYATIRQELRGSGAPIPVNDIWIAALARQHDLPILSADRHFDAVAGVHRISW